NPDTNGVMAALVSLAGVLFAGAAVRMRLHIDPNRMHDWRPILAPAWIETGGLATLLALGLAVPTLDASIHSLTLSVGLVVAFLLAGYYRRALFSIIGSVVGLLLLVHLLVVVLDRIPNPLPLAMLVHATLALIVGFLLDRWSHDSQIHRVFVQPLTA